MADLIPISQKIKFQGTSKWLCNRMNLLKSMENLRICSSVAILRRFYGKTKECCEEIISNPPHMDEICPKCSRCLKGQYQQHWVDCPQPIVIRPRMQKGQIPFIKRKTKPKTASECLKMRDCNFSQTTPKYCKYTHREECERIPPPCPAFSEILRFKPVPELTECVCLSTEMPPLRFGYQTPCYDPRETAGSDEC